MQVLWRSMRPWISPKPTAKRVFTKIYRTNAWKSAESISGPGSEISQTKVVVAELSKLLQEKSIASILDIPCGDFNWMQQVDLSDVHYLGADIVKAIVRENARKYGNKRIRFEPLDLIQGPLPRVDLILSRDCLVHFCFSDAFAALTQIRASNSTYLLTTTFPSTLANTDAETGPFRPLNLQVAPFHFPPPILLINEKCTENEGRYSDKSLGLWRIKDINTETR